jgi:excinuclease UvrABC nuclease subunit
MNPRFSEVSKKLDSLYKQLVAMHPVTASSLPKTMPKKGIYIFSENGQHLYVGRSNDIRGRIGRHCRPGATHRMAAFAFKLARQATGFLKATYKKEGSRKELMGIPEFSNAFSTAKERIRKMDLRFIEVNDPIQQAIFEIYVSIALQTPYNDFDNH